jgi:molybdopterin/thiamine biosynthesis adenylyltransferase
MTADYRDQRAIFDPDAFTWPVHVIGLGGIGSAAVFPLIKLGVRELHLWDRDEVEPHNVPAQLLYRATSDMDKNKVRATAKFIKRQEADCKVVCHDEYVTADTPLEGVVISGVDSMDSRMKIWQAVKLNPFVPFYMDGRIGGEQLQLHTVVPSDIEAIEAYEQAWLFPDEEGLELPCAARTVIHPPTVLAGLIVAQLTLFLRKEEFKPGIFIDLKKMQFITT